MTKRIERLLRASQLPQDKSWPALDLKRFPPKVLQQARVLLEGSFRGPANVLVFGSVGSGKRICSRGLPRNWCGRVEGAVHDVRPGAGVADRQARPEVEPGAEASVGYGVLVIDDLGYVHAEAGRRWRCCSRCWRSVTSAQCDADEQPAVLEVGADLEDAMTTAAAIDRLVHHDMRSSN